MTTLDQLKAAVDKLTVQEQERLMMFLSERLRIAHGLPEPRTFTQEQIDEWVAQDEADMRALEAARAAK